jgi:hypothetical protein
VNRHLGLDEDGLAQAREALADAPERVSNRTPGQAHRHRAAAAPVGAAADRPVAPAATPAGKKGPPASRAEIDLPYSYFSSTLGPSSGLFLPSPGLPRSSLDTPPPILAELDLYWLSPV